MGKPSKIPNNNYYRRDLDKSKCKNKMSFKGYKEALELAEDYMDEVAMTFHPMVPYWCTRHNVWHIGHNSYIKREYKVDGGISSDGYGEAIL